MYATYRTRAHIFVLYIREAHPTDGRQTQSNVREGILVESPKTKKERNEIAREFASQFKISLPILVDGIDNKVGSDYSAWPDRIYIIDARGKIAYKGGPGPFGFRVSDVPPVLDRLLGVRLASTVGSDSAPRRPGGGRPGTGFRRFRDPLAMTLDLNKDGEIDAEEIKKASNSLRKLDRNGDGQLSANEIRSSFRRGPGLGRGSGNTEELVEQIMSRDKNEDGKLDRDELGAQAARYLRIADKNGDGTLDQKEVQTLAERFGRGRGRGR